MLSSIRQQSTPGKQQYETEVCVKQALGETDTMNVWKETVKQTNKSKTCCQHLKTAFSSPFTVLCAAVLSGNLVACGSPHLGVEQQLSVPEIIWMSFHPNQISLRKAVVVVEAPLEALKAVLAVLAMAVASGIWHSPGW